MNLTGGVPGTKGGRRRGIGVGQGRGNKIECVAGGGVDFELLAAVERRGRHVGNRTGDGRGGSGQIGIRIDGDSGPSDGAGTGVGDADIQSPILDSGTQGREGGVSRHNDPCLAGKRAIGPHALDMVGIDGIHQGLGQGIQIGMNVGNDIVSKVDQGRDLAPLDPGDEGRGPFCPKSEVGTGHEGGFQRGRVVSQHDGDA